MAKGFNRPMGAGGGMGGMMQQIRKMQEQIEQAQEQLKNETVTGIAQGGAIKVTMTGDQVCKGIQIDPEFLKDMDAEMLQDILLTAVNNALDKSRQMAEEKLGPLAGGMPGLGF